MLKTSKSATIIGMMAALFWSFAAPVITFASDVNAFLYAALVHGIMFLAFGVIWLIKRENPLPKLKLIPKWFYLTGLACISVHVFFWILALQNAPPVESVLMIYTWPLMVVFFTAFALRQKLYGYHYIGSFLGFLGVIVLLSGKGLNLSELSIQSGHLYALLSAVTWSIYAAVSTKQKHLSVYAYAVIYLFNAPLNFLLWYFVADAQPASVISLIVCAVYGILSLSAYLCWDYGMKKGNTQIISVTSFMIPVLATFYVIMMGKGAYTPNFVVALVLVMISIFIVKFGPKFFQKNIS